MDKQGSAADSQNGGTEGGLGERELVFFRASYMTKKRSRKKRSSPVANPDLRGAHKRSGVVCFGVNQAAKPGKHIYRYDSAPLGCGAEDSLPHSRPHARVDSGEG